MFTKALRICKAEMIGSELEILIDGWFSAFNNEHNATEGYVLFEKDNLVKSPL